MANSAELDLRVFKSVRVKAPIQLAWSVFVEQMETWWPPTHHIGNTPFEAIFIEPRVGGRWYERSAKGELCDWGRVLHWEPPTKVCLSWHVGPGHDRPEWVADMDMAKASEVEIRFTAEAGGTTLVELTHRKIERHGDGAEQLRDIFDGPGAWVTILDFFAKKVEDRNEGSQGRQM
jgi:hypothetical protein